jgi:hypothetical protein
MMSSSFYVDQYHRGAGTSLFMKFLQLGRRHALFVSSANAPVAHMWQRLGAYPVGHSDHEMLGIVRWHGVVEEALGPKFGNAPAVRLLTRLASPLRWRLRPCTARGSLIGLKSPEEAATICTWGSPERLATVRDVPYLGWRYFSEVDPSARLYAFRPDGANKHFLIGVNQRRRGNRQQIAALNVLDVFGEADPKSYDTIAKLLIREYHDQIDMLVFRCLDPARQEALRAAGFVRRQFDAPIAWCMDKFGHLPSTGWYFVSADGDMLL